MHRLLLAVKAVYFITCAGLILAMSCRIIYMALNFPIPADSPHHTVQVLAGGVIAATIGVMGPWFTYNILICGLNELRELFGRERIKLGSWNNPG